MIVGTCSLVQFLLALLLALAAIPTARAQDHPPVGDLASEIAVALEKFSVKSAVVFNFTGPDTFVTPVGGMLADDLSDVLARSSSKFKVIDRTRAMKALDSNRLAPEITSDPEVAAWIAESIGAELAIVGKLSSDGSNLRLTLDCLLAREGKSLQSFQATFPLSDKWKADLSMNIDQDSAVSAILVPGTDAGISVPHCSSCPAPEFPRATRGLEGSGKVLLQVVIGTDGKARDINILKTPDHGLTIVAVQNIQKWRFQPARDAHKKPMVTRIPIELDFSRR